MRAQHTDRIARQGIALATRAFEAIDFAFREQHESDYGIDAHVELIQGSSPTGRLLGIQVKAGRSYLSETIGGRYVFRADATHVDYWVNHALPVLVCLVDLENDLVHWQVIDNDTAELTNSNYRIFVPKHQVIDRDSLPPLHDLLTIVVPSERYTLSETKDQSHATAKRYSFKAVLNGTFSKAEIASIVRQITTQGAQRRYYRSHRVEQRWGDSDAQVIWSFVYPSMADLANNNFKCRGLWINPGLPERERPTAFQGENVGDGIIVDWNPNYDLMAGLFSEHESTKEEYLRAATPLVQGLEDLIEFFRQALRSLIGAEMTRGAFVRRSQAQLDNAAQIYREVVDMPGAPFECKEVDNLLQQAAGNIDNIPILFSETNEAKWSDERRFYLASEQVNDAATTMQALKYELQKIR
ncbi:MAG: DUF4365 domain-containing protein [Chloroflexota bacterium]|nr:DUF4365 domain-containing protein [Chloroflexota bacterium]MDE2893774.1 DUF4365 domain-containing protein [Chloroflexota bacterium]